MKKKDIKWNGLKYSAYSDRGKQVIEIKRREKAKRTAVPISILLTMSLITLKSQFA